jgi:hypothetical protein
MAHETFQEDIADLWVIYQSLKAQYIELIALKTSLLTFYGTIATTVGGAGDDFTTYTRSGLDGAESWTRESLLKRIEVLSQQEVELRKAMQAQRLLAIKASPGIVRRPIRQRGCFR